LSFRHHHHQSSNHWCYKVPLLSYPNCVAESASEIYRPSDRRPVAESAVKQERGQLAGWKVSKANVPGTALSLIPVGLSLHRNACLHDEKGV
jgi:hypothetical protein